MLFMTFYVTLIAIFKCHSHNKIIQIRMHNEL